MKSYKEKMIESKDKQKWLDEIHMKPEVKKEFVINEVFLTIQWFFNILLLLIICYTILESDITNILDLEYLFMTFLEGFGIWAIGAYAIIKLAISKYKKKHAEKLQVLEDAGITEIKQAIADGTYVEGAKPSKAYKIFYHLRWIILFALCIVMFYLFYKRYF